jgi:hypothetical protein
MGLYGWRRVPLALAMALYVRALADSEYSGLADDANLYKIH